ncbi:glycosyltransferase family 4 protein [Knoellia subterranea]|uniref:Glycosyl transferase n=1 Tax=Knoellia subterranea KCTC 19937 TaxID=1385521 RepID=A0A0A0JMV7_9MICO|nr:glycosyltransferase family 4 protein [Knoellia subterranea]KGN36951.1 glycosyl transferase [Knoellia subterranea KCTC 19937]
MSDNGSTGAGSAALRLAVVGPTHPYKGGVASHTTELCHELAEAGHDVTLVSWSHLYPSLLYPGEQAVPGGAPDVDPFPRTIRALSWARPDTWVRTGRRLRDMDAIIVVHVIPPGVPSNLAVLRAAGVGRTSSSGLGPRSIVIAHNVLPHEARPGDRQFMDALFRRVDSVVVHSDSQAKLATELGAAHVREFDLPPHLPGGPPVEHVESTGPTRLLALGIVRDYKGVDLLLDAMLDVPDLRLTIAGEMWGDSGRRVKELAADPRLADRVEVHSGYVPADRIAALMARHDVLTLTYRHATASQNVLLARRHGLPVLATHVGTFGSQVRHGIDGLLVPPNDRAALVSALRRLADRPYAGQLRAAVRPPDLSGPWAHYVGGIEALASAESDALVDDAQPAEVPADTPLQRAKDLVTAARLRRRKDLPLRPTDFPEWVRASDLLALDNDALDAQALGRDLGLPRASDAVAAWAALGALAAILRIRDDGRRRAVIVDESGTRSPFSRWARAVGFEPVELELTGRRTSVEVLDVDTASLDVIVRLHPGGCGADDVDHAVGQASWALKSGGLLILTLPVGEDDPEWAVSPADLRGVLARADDLGLVLVGDVDGDIGEQLRDASASARALREAREERDAREARDAQPRGRHEGAPPAYGILRLTFRRR